LNELTFFLRDHTKTLNDLAFAEAKNDHWQFKNAKQR